MDDIFKKYDTARSLYRELTNILLLCINESNYYYHYCDNDKHINCTLCQFCEYFPDVKIENLSCEKFLQLNYNKKDKLNTVVDLIRPFFDQVKSEKKGALDFFYKEYYWHSRDIATGDIKYVSLDEIIESNKKNGN